MTYAKGQGAANPTTHVVTGSVACWPQGTAGPTTAEAGRPPITCPPRAALPSVSSPHRA